MPSAGVGGIDVWVGKSISVGARVEVVFGWDVRVAMVSFTGAVFGVDVVDGISQLLRMGQLLIRAWLAHPRKKIAKDNPNILPRSR